MSRNARGERVGRRQCSEGASTADLGRPQVAFASLGVTSALRRQSHALTIAFASLCVGVGCVSVLCTYVVLWSKTRQCLVSHSHYEA